MWMCVFVVWERREGEEVMGGDKRLDYTIIVISSFLLTHVFVNCCTLFLFLPASRELSLHFVSPCTQLFHF